MEFEKWKGAFSIDAEGTTENEAQENQDLLSDFVEYIKVETDSADELHSTLYLLCLIFDFDVVLISNSSLLHMYVFVHFLCVYCIWYAVQMMLQ